MAMNQPVRTSLIPQLLEGRLLVNALSLNSIAVNVTRLAGPAAIGFLTAASGDNVGPAYVVASVVYMLVLLSTAMIHFPRRQAANRGTSIGQDVVEGFRYMLMENRTVLALVILAMGPLAFAFSYIIFLPVFVAEVLHMGPSGFGAIQSISAIGALIGGLTPASMGRVPRKGVIMLTAALAYGIVVVMLVSVQLPAFAFGVVIIAGASQTVFRSLNNGTLLEITPQRLQGRVISLTFLDMCVQSAAAVVAGAVSDA